MSRSLSRRLLGILYTVILTAWIATAYFSYLDARQKIDEVLDSNLVQSASLLLTLLHRTGPEGGSPLVPTAGGGETAFRALDATGRPILRSIHFPDLSADLAEGFADVTLDGIRWRVLGARDEASGYRVHVAERHAPRIALAGSVVSHLLHPVWIAFPILTGLIWLSVKWGLAPLMSLAQELKLRDPGKLELLDERAAPLEVRPLIHALNSLFGRVTALQDRERQFTADAAHELRTPLAAIRTHTEVARGAQRPEELLRAIDNVVRGTDRAAHLIDQLLVLGKLESQGIAPSFVPVALIDVATQAITECAPLAAARNIDLGLADAEAAAPGVDGNADLLIIMARNLVDNAVRYAHPGGTVRVVLKGDPAGVSFAVADDGPGLPAGERERVFDRFYRRIGTGQEGSGLGLSIVARIAELHRAAIALDSGIGGRGLTVTVTFPAPAT